MLQTVLYVIAAGFFFIDFFGWKFLPVNWSARVRSGWSLLPRS